MFAEKVLGFLVVLIHVWKLLLVGLLLCGLCPLSDCLQAGGNLGYNVTKMLNDTLEKYDKTLRPGFGGPPTQVGIFMNIRSMGPISEENMDYSMDAYFRQVWVDKRLSHSLVDKINSDNTVLDRIWKPDTFFGNGKESFVHSVTKPNKLARIYNNGTILYSVRLTIKATCPMNLQHFPADRQACLLRIRSYAFTRDEVIYSWKYGTDHSMNVFQGLAISQFSLRDIVLSAANTTNHLGEFSTLGITFNLQRHLGYFLIHIYVPSMLIVAASWISFWINREVTAERAGLGVTAVLTLTALIMESRDIMPPISYPTALDWYVLVCLAFIIATLPQFAAVHYFTKVGSGETLDLPGVSDEEDSDQGEVFRENAHGLISTVAFVDLSADAVARRYGLSDPEEQFGTSQSLPRLESRASSWMTSFRKCIMKCVLCMKGSHSYKQKMAASKELTDMNSVSIIDKVSRVLFPVIFIIFNCVYLLLLMP